jgi:glycosyltransferase involved in cell wall biosynthesis
VKKHEKKKVALIGAVSYPGGISRVVQTMISSPELREAYDLRLFNTSRYKDGSRLTNLAEFIRSFIRYATALSRRQVDLAHIHASYGRSFFRKTFFLALTSVFRVKSVFHFHTGRFEEFYIRGPWARRKILGFLLRRTDAIIVLCQQWKDELEKRYGSGKVRVIHNPIPFTLEGIPEKRDRVDQPGVQILYLGFMIKTKGIYDIIDLAERLQRERLDALIILGGKGEEEEPFLRQARARNLGNIDFLGWVDESRRLTLLKDSDIFLLPSYYEGNNSSILEAIAYGLPVVTTRVGGTPEMVREAENGFLLEPGDTVGTFEKIKWLILHPDERRRMGQRGRLLAERFRKDIIAHEWRELYRNLLGQG